jgi:hypothetical protein
MLLLAADENFNNDIVRGLLRRKPDLDIARVQDAGLSGADDSDVLEWAARENRVLLTSVSIGVAIDDILLLVECSLENEWEGQVRYLPLR